MAPSVWNVIMRQSRESDSILGVFSSNLVAQQFVKGFIESDFKFITEDVEDLTEIQEYIFLETTPGVEWANDFVTLSIEKYVIDDDAYYDCYQCIL